MFIHMFKHVCVETFDRLNRSMFKSRFSSLNRFKILNRKGAVCLNIVRLHAESLNRLNTTPPPNPGPGASSVFGF